MGWEAEDDDWVCHGCGKIHHTPSLDPKYHNRVIGVDLNLCQEDCFRRYFDMTEEELEPFERASSYLRITDHDRDGRISDTTIDECPMDPPCYAHDSLYHAPDTLCIHRLREIIVDDRFGGDWIVDDAFGASPWDRGMLARVIRHHPDFESDREDMLKWVPGEFGGPWRTNLSRYWEYIRGPRWGDSPQPEHNWSRFFDWMNQHIPPEPSFDDDFQEIFAAETKYHPLGEYAAQLGHLYDPVIRRAWPYITTTSWDRGYPPSIGWNDEDEWKEYMNEEWDEGHDDCGCNKGELLIYPDDAVCLHDFKILMMEEPGWLADTLESIIISKGLMQQSPVMNRQDFIQEGGSLKPFHHQHPELSHYLNEVLQRQYDETDDEGNAPGDPDYDRDYHEYELMGWDELNEKYGFSEQEVQFEAEDDWAAEDHTIDNLDDESLMIRMENLAERMDAIVQRIGSYPDAERDPEYLRLVEQHTAYARVLARRHGFGAEDGSESGDEEVCGNCKTTREERSVLPHRLSRGETKTTRKLGLCYDCDSCYDCCWLVCEPNDVRDDHGFEAESGDDEVCIRCGTTRDERSVQPHRLNRGETKSTYKLGLHECGGCSDCCWIICDYRDEYDGFSAESDPVSTAVYIGPGNHLSVADAIDSDHFVLIESQPRTEYKGGEHEMDSGMQHYFMDQLMDMAKALNYELKDFEGGLNDQNASRLTFKTPSGKTIDYYYNSVYPFADGQEIPEVMESLSTADRLIISGFHPEEQLLNDMPNLNLVYLYEHTHYPTEKNDHFDDFGNPTVIKGFFERGDESHPSALQFVIMGMDEDYESGNITDQYIEQGPFGGAGVTWEYPEVAEQMERNSRRRVDEAAGQEWFEAESDPISRIAAGTNDAIANFANANDTDDRLYFLGGIVGGLVIAITGNIMATQIQNWFGRRSS